MKPYKRILLMISGFVCLGLGISGVVLPVMPGALFLFLSALSFAKSSRKFHDWLIQHPIWGKPIREPISVRVRVAILFCTWSGIGLSVYFFAKTNASRISAIVAGIVITSYFLVINTLKKSYHVPAQPKEPG